MIAFPVKPPVQATVPVQPVAVSTELVPEQMEALVLVTVGAFGFGFTVIYVIALESLLQPF